MPSLPVGANEAADIRARLREVEHDASENAGAISSHEKVCIERYKALELNIKSLSNRMTIIMAMVMTVILGETVGWKEAIGVLVKLVGAP